MRFKQHHHHLFIKLKQHQLQQQQQQRQLVPKKLSSICIKSANAAKTFEYFTKNQELM